ncbi:GntR family transcriptional regulator [Mycolicibacterium moriokaense]|uniref:GntR family transcriptional regulator n=1 Tax=Mycolicibacterium moriokaense TaxID=39691 RepID=A0AAD1H6Q5_9MYCO|nr:PLP-dependent aminotransferase family protein [Mycolicibacterium moriokaense]MCV7042971.1 PLP-dependent aminotransferase family protein [Mycolicibacterium moriokaense]ORB14591.1 GntR family transcriptional regulator [Mycolicibacterium moriokaense]BBW99862.1 GntR family transcriptional regulator [Mycolicibacterium moriokaense]
MTSWANPGSRDLHLDLRETITPGVRGARELLLTALRDAVRSGRLAAGTMLPPSRSLAADLGLARNTVAEAYAELVAEGWLASRQGAGTWVVNTSPAQRPARPRGIRVVPRHNLIPGNPDVSEFPRSEWAAATRRALTNAPNEALRMGDPRGRPELRDALAEYLSRARGVRTSPESIVICAGVRHAIELMGRVLGPQRPIAVEAYGLFIFRDALAAMGISTVPIGLDEDGAVVKELDRLDVPAVLLTPAHHNPYGMTLHPSRRTAVVDWAQRTDGYVLDDDYDGEFRYDRQPIGALQALSPERVVYLGSASKSLSPVLRLGWMALPTDLVDAVVAAQGGSQFYVDGITQLTMAEFITGGGYDKHIRRMRMRYRRRRDQAVQALSSGDISIRGLDAGLNLTLTLPDGAEREVLQRAGEAGIALQGLSIMRHPQAGPDVPQVDGLVIGFGTPPDHAFGAAIDALRAVLIASGLGG